MGRKKSAAKKAREAELKLAQETNPEATLKSIENEKKRKLEDEQDSESYSDDDESSTSEEEDDFGDLLTEDVEQGINQVLNAIKTGDKSLFDNNVKFFKEPENNSTDTKEKPQKPIYLKDYQRMNLLDGHAFEDEDGEERDWKNEEKPYALQQKEDKDKLLAAFNDDDDNNEEDFLVKKEKKQSDEAKEKDDELPDPETHGENFLEAYMNNHAWIPTKNSKEVDLESDDDEFDDAVEEFEHAYNFRFEDPEAASIVSYARSQATMRREKTNSRKKERQRKQDETKNDKTEKDELLKKKKQKKVNQVMDRINEIKRAVGDEVPEEVIMRVFGDSLLKDDFDDSEWDSKMAEIFNDEYYTNEISKPEWDEDDDIMAEFIDKQKKELENENEKDDEKDDDDEEEVEQNIDGDDTVEEKSKKAKKKEAKHEKKNKKAKSKETAEKIVNLNTLQLLDEVEEERGRKKSKDEDVKFKYRDVSPESFGLTTREILLAEDVDLNEFIGIKKFAPYREKQAQLKDKRKYAKKKRLRDWRMKVFNSADGPKVEEGEEDIIKIPSIVNKSSNKHKSNKHKSKKRKTEKSG